MKTGVRADENVPADATNAPVTDPAQIKIFEAYQPLVFAFGYMTKKQVLPLKKTLEITLAKTMQQAAPELYTTEKYTMHVAFRNPRNEILHYENNFFGRMDEDSNPVWADSIISAF
jgi:hypothetical protein